MKVYSGLVLISFAVVVVTSQQYRYGYKYNKNPYTGECRLQLNLPGYGDKPPPRRYGSPYPKIGHQSSPSYNANQHTSQSSRRPSSGRPYVGRFTSQISTNQPSPPERRFPSQMTNRPPVERIPSTLTDSYTHHKSNVRYSSADTNHPPPQSYNYDRVNGSPPPAYGSSPPVRDYADSKFQPRPQFTYDEDVQLQNHYNRPSFPAPLPLRESNYVPTPGAHRPTFNDYAPPIDGIEQPESFDYDYDYVRTQPVRNQGVSSVFQEPSRRYGGDNFNRFARRSAKHLEGNAIKYGEGNSTSTTDIGKSNGQALMTTV